MFLPEEDKYTQRKFEMLDHLVVAMGGRVAEEIVFGDVTNGAGGDIKMATDVARKMVCQWGMSEDLGMVEYGDHQEHTFLARDMSTTRSYSEDTAQKIDNEVKRFIDTAYNKAREMLLSHREQLDLIAHALLEYETLDASHIKDLMDDGEMGNPPPSPTPPDFDSPKKSSSNNSEKQSADDDISPGDLAPVGA
jgi:cell division protease FtsH